MYKSFFDQVCIINLPKSIVRLENVLSRFSLAGFSHELTICNAVCGLDTGFPSWWHSSYGEWGRLRSHINTIERAATDNRRNILIFEDDVVIRSNFIQNLNNSIKELPDDWGMLYLGGLYDYSIDGPPKSFSDHLYQCTSVSLTYAYAINHKVMYDLYTWLFNLTKHKWHNLSDIIREFQIVNKPKIYAVKDWLIGHGAGISTITGNVNGEDYHDYSYDTYYKPIKLSNNITVRCLSSNNGSFGFDGLLSYSNDFVSFDNIDNLSNVVWINPNAPSEIDIELSSPITVFGAVNNDVDKVDLCSFYINGEHIGSCFKGNTKTFSCPLKPGKHKLCIYSTADKSVQHMLWGFISDSGLTN